MKAFRFRPDAVLRWRRQLQDEAKGAAQAAQRTAEDADAAVRRAMARLDESRRQLDAAMARDGDGGDVEWHRTWSAHLQRESKRLCVLRDQRVAEARAAFDVLRTAHQNVRVFERLRERALQNYMVRVTREDNKRIDDLAVQQHGRRSAQGDGSDDD